MQERSGIALLLWLSEVEVRGKKQTRSLAVIYIHFTASPNRDSPPPAGTLCLAQSRRSHDAYSQSPAAHKGRLDRLARPPDP